MSLFTKFLAIQVFDRNSREKTITIFISIFTAVFLILAAIIYVLSNPFTAIAGFFKETQLSSVETFHNQYNFNNEIAEDSEDYIFSSEFDFSSYNFESSSVDIVYYNQADKRWKNIPYGRTGTVGRSGCGPTALSMVISTLSDRTINPVEMCRWSHKNGYYVEGAGSMHRLIPAGAKHFGLKVEGVGTNARKIINALSDGKLVIVIMGKGHFTRAGHFIVLRGITDEGKILVADPASIKRSEQEWDLSLIIKESKKSADAGGPFWIIGR